MTEMVSNSAYVQGLDLSLSATGIAMAPVDWGGDWSKVVTRVAGYPKPSTVAGKADLAELGELTWEQYRIEDIVLPVVRGARVAEVCHVYAESAHVSPINIQAGMKLARLRGAVDYALHDGLKVVAHDVAPSAHRKLLYGYGGGTRYVVKKATKEALIASGAPSDWTEDEYEAASVMNYGMCQQGSFFYGVEA